jgi:GNAT superfamily N-acetyltransferase
MDSSDMDRCSSYVLLPTWKEQKKRRWWNPISMKKAQQHLPEGYSIRLMSQADYAQISEICRMVYPTERPYSDEELSAHHQLFPEGQFVVCHEESGGVAGVHFTLLIQLAHFHIDDDWETLTAGGTFFDHDPAGHTLYGADLFIHPNHQHHGLAKALTVATRELVSQRKLWRMVGGSRMPGYGKLARNLDPQEYIAKVKNTELTDPVLTAHLHDGWDVITAIRGYLPHDEESAGWAAVIQWINQECTPPPDVDISRISRKNS